MIISMAWRNIWRNKMRSIVIMLSVSIGLFAGIAVLALYKGMMKSRVRTVIDSEVGHLQVHHPAFLDDHEPAYVLPDGQQLYDSLVALPEVLMVAPRTVTQGMLTTTTGSAGVQVNGVIPTLEYSFSQLRKKIIDGNPFDSTKKNEVMIGKKLAGKMKLRLGSKLVLTFTDSAAGIVSGAFRVAAIYQSDNTPLDERNVYVTHQDLGSLLGTGTSFHELGIMLKEDELVKSIHEQLKSRYPAYRIQSWKEISPETDLLVNTVNQYSYIIMTIIMIALAFGIINTMLMAILERTREIGMMMALGTNRLRIFLLVLLETVFLTLAGAPIGLLVGLLATSYFSKHGLDLGGMGEEMMSSFGFQTFIYPEFPGDKLVGVLIIVAGTAIVSCIFPALKALRLRPVDALKR